jgi:hypothetical protein
MSGLAEQVWVVFAVVAGVGVLSLLHFVASSLGNAAYVHDMRVRVAALRKERMERLQAITDAADAAERASMAIAAKVTRRAA